jgi:DNA-binding winged helix-turn-helix (wHTH) protein
MFSQTKVIFEFGPFRLNPAERLLLRHQVQVRLPPKAFDALVVLVENRGHLLEKDELLRKVWPAPSSKSRILPSTSRYCAKHCRMVRTALATSKPYLPGAIVSLRRFGMLAALLRMVMLWQVLPPATDRLQRLLKVQFLRVALPKLELPTVSCRGIASQP